MSLVDALRFALRALAGSRLRTLLSLLGVAIGVAAVIILTALGEGARLYVVGQFSNLGTNLVVVMPGRTETTGVVPGVIGTPNDLTLADAEAIGRHVRQTLYVAPISMATETISFGERRRQIAVVGTTRAYLDVRDLSLRKGQFLAPGEADRGSAQVVLGANVARELFAAANPVGAVVRVGSWRMRVIGVMEPTGTQLGVNLDEIVLIPVATALRMFNKSSLFRILIRLKGYADLDQGSQAVRQLLHERHGEEDFSVLSEEALASTFSSILTALTLALGAIAAISLSVAGLGVMNVMLVSVSERTGEIGLLRAVGVARRQVMQVFLFEAVMLSTLGGLVGLAVGFGGVRLLVQLFPAFPAAPPTWAVTAALAVSLAVGGLFGFLPARRAAQLDPIVALGRK